MFHFSGSGFTPDVPTQIGESMQIDQDNKSREEEVKDNTHVQKVSRRTSAGS